MAANYLYLDVEDRLYRAPTDSYADMEIWTSDHQWEPYKGDVAKVLLDGQVVDAEHIADEMKGD